MDARLIIIDDHPLFRSGVSHLVDMDPDLALVGEASDGDEGIALAARTNPDLILLDLHMKGRSGLETLRALRDSGCDARIIILTVSDNPDDIVAAIRAGADGYLLKDMDPLQLIGHIREALLGRKVIDLELNALLARALRNDGERESRRPDLLTEREKTILRCLANGMSNKLIARTLNITEGTVKVHIKNLLKKLEFHSRLEAAVWAVEQGLRDCITTE